MRVLSSLLLALALSLAACRCGRGQVDPVPAPGEQALVFTTTASGTQLFEQSEVMLIKPSEAGFNRITLTGEAVMVYEGEFEY